jgi:hypothetical protein
MSAAFRTDEADPPPAAARPSSGHYEAVVQQVREAKGDCCYTCTNCCDLEKRANHKRMLIFHRTSALSFWFAMLVLGIAFILGAMIKRANIENPAAWDPSDLTNLNTQNIDIYDMLYWITFCSWSGRWYIQAILNFTRGRTIGLSVNYVMWSFLAGVCNALAVVVSKATDRSIASFDTRSGPIGTSTLSVTLYYI